MALVTILSMSVNPNCAPLPSVLPEILGFSGFLAACRKPIKPSASQARTPDWGPRGARGACRGCSPNSVGSLTIGGVSCCREYLVRDCGWVRRAPPKCFNGAKRVYHYIYYEGAVVSDEGKCPRFDSARGDDACRREYARWASSGRV